MPTMAELSNWLFFGALGLYMAAMLAYFFRMAFTRATVDGVLMSTRSGERAGLAATALALTGAGVHLGSVVTRGLAAQRVPWANMYEYSSVMALIAVAAGLLVVQRRMGYGHLMGFVLAASVIMMSAGAMLFVPAGPTVPALESYWLKIHVTAMVSASAVFILAFVTTALYLARDTAERRVAARSGGRFTAGTVGAASVDLTVGEGERQRAGGRGAEGEGERQRAGGRGVDASEVETDAVAPAGEAVIGSPLELRRVMPPVWFAILPAAFFFVWGLLKYDALRGASMAPVGALLGVGAWYALPHLPSAAQLDMLAYRVTAFALPIFTFAIICGAIWAEEAWGRYWGWDPKETGSFFTWVLYAAYLHARATHGWRGRRAAWIGAGAFLALMVTYFAVNLFVVGLHSYAT
jgi:ABC-type transport system involved in cytochrome c biogenesis permease subunit